MNCPNCHQSVETGAAYCGNCGQQLQAILAAAGIPAYALATPAQHSGEIKALLSVVLGIMSLVSLAFITLLGLAFGIAGIVTGTMSRSGSRRGLGTAGMVISVLAITASVAVWAHTINQVAVARSRSVTAQNTTQATAAASLTTPCYSVGFIDTLNISNSSSSCNMSAYSGKTLATSSNAYKIYANKSAVASDSAIGGLAKQALEKDVKTSLPGFAIDTEQAALFAGSQAYFVHVSDKAHGIAVVEAVVYHTTASGNNTFVLVHANVGKTADLNTLEAQWQWK